MNFTEKEKVSFYISLKGSRRTPHSCDIVTAYAYMLPNIWWPAWASALWWWLTKIQTTKFVSQTEPDGEAANGNTLQDRIHRTQLLTFSDCVFDNWEESNKTEGNTNTGGKRLDGFWFWHGLAESWGQSSTSFKNRLRVYYYNLKANTSQRVLMDESPIKGTSIKDFSEDHLGNIP